MSNILKLELVEIVVDPTEFEPILLDEPFEEHSSVANNSSTDDSKLETRYQAVVHVNGDKIGMEGVVDLLGFIMPVSWTADPLYRKLLTCTCGDAGCLGLSHIGVCADDAAVYWHVPEHSMMSDSAARDVLSSIPHSIVHTCYGELWVYAFEKASYVELQASLKEKHYPNLMVKEVSESLSLMQVLELYAESVGPSHDSYAKLWALNLVKTSVKYQALAVIPDISVPVKLTFNQGKALGPLPYHCALHEYIFQFMVEDAALDENDKAFMSKLKWYVVSLDLETLLQKLAIRKTYLEESLQCFEHYYFEAVSEEAMAVPVLADPLNTGEVGDSQYEDSELEDWKSQAFAFNALASIYFNEIAGYEVGKS